MSKEQCVLAVLMSGLIFTTSCGQDQQVHDSENAQAQKEEVLDSPYTSIHQYGGWYCPDNFGFAPVDIRDLDKIPVVTDRLPTLEETRNGTSLMYFNTDKIPDARALEMELPRLARVKHDWNGMEELVIVIQAVVAGPDTVVGYRFPHGGNGSAWYREVDFLSEEAVRALGAQPMVFVEAEIDASRENIWKAFTATDYARHLGEKFNQQEFFASEWSDDARATLETDNDKFRATGFVGMHFGNLYLHIDYDHNGHQYSEKMLLLEGEDVNSVKLQMALGPFPKEYNVQKAVWEKWVVDLKAASEKG